MTGRQTPAGWIEQDGKHPSDGVVARSVRWFRHRDGAELVIWSGVEESGRDYEVDDGPVFAVELEYPDGRLLSGYAFEGREAAERKAHEMMANFQTDE